MAEGERKESKRKKFILGTAHKLPFSRILVREIYYKFFALKSVNNAYVAIYKLVGNTPAVLLGEGYDGILTLPGGTADAQDASPFHTALRELEEETQIVLNPGYLAREIAAYSKWHIGKRWYRRERHFFSVLFIYPWGLHKVHGETLQPQRAKDGETVGFHWLTLADLERADITRRIPGNAEWGHEYLVRFALQRAHDALRNAPPSYFDAGLLGSLGVLWERDYHFNP